MRERHVLHLLLLDFTVKRFFYAEYAGTRIKRGRILPPGIGVLLMFKFECIYKLRFLIRR